MKEKIKWTDEQIKIIEEMIANSEDIGYTQGWDDAIKEIVQELGTFIFELKKKFWSKKE